MNISFATSGFTVTAQGIQDSLVRGSGSEASSPDSPKQNSSAADPAYQPDSPGTGDGTGSDGSSGLAAGAAQLNDEERAQVEALSMRDREVRTHEQQHAAVGGQYAGAPSYEFERGPDGRLYAVAGEVSIDTSPVSGDPQATLEKAEVIQRAAMAPAEPSGADRKVAAAAAAMAAEARAEIAAQNAEAVRGEEGGEVSESQAAEQGDTPDASRSRAAAEDNAVQAERSETADNDFQPLDAVNQRLIQSGVRSSLFPPGSLFDLQA